MIAFPNDMANFQVNSSFDAAPRNSDARPNLTPMQERINLIINYSIDSNYVPLQLTAVTSGLCALRDLQMRRSDTDPCRR
jgi:hypothetical protein